jgi:hypothetical protein
VIGYSSAHETSHLRTYTFKEGAPGSGGRVALQRCLRPASLPDPFGQRPGRTCAPDSRKSRVWLPDGAQNAIHDFDEHGLGALQAGSSRPEEVHAAFDAGEAESLRQMLHHHPSEFRKEGTFWTLSMAAEVSFEEGLTERRVSGETIRATLARLGVRWQRAKRWMESPDPEYARKKGIEIG